MGYHIFYNTSEEFLVDESAKKLSYFLIQKDVLLLLSGGSALKLLDSIETTYLNENITITVLDERYSTDSTTNNFGQIMQTEFYKKANENKCRFIDTRVKENETIDELAARFEHDLRNWKTAHPNGVIAATQGIGPDGHTAGIMPYSEDAALFQKLFVNTDRWVVDYDAGNKNQYSLRVTTTIPFLKMIDHSIVFATGENKKDILKNVIASDYKLNELPGKVIREMKDVLIFTDQKVQ